MLWLTQVTGEIIKQIIIQLTLINSSLRDYQVLHAVRIKQDLVYHSLFLLGLTDSILGRLGSKSPKVRNPIFYWFILIKFYIIVLFHFL